MGPWLPTCSTAAAIRGHWSRPDGGLYSGQQHGQAGTSTNRMLLSCLCCPTASYTASQNTVARTSTVWLSHITDILPSVLSFQRTVLAACSPAPACTHKAVLVNTYPSVVQCVANVANRLEHSCCGLCACMQPPGTHPLAEREVADVFVGLIERRQAFQAAVSHV